ncbi:hypothetical protein FRB94_009925 [Tulasnella sp. JGI-2019a]|nr:hypothetical protein FRB93_006929 [Tulasnella sp. JGI-2019a]KAG8994387.1 hypothetical protein FRB94_009925 [Tulasnella sp. JGI-2019a]
MTTMAAAHLSQMAHTRTAFSRLKLAIDQRSRQADCDILKPWDDLLHSLGTNYITSRRWMELLQSKLIPDMVESLIPSTIEFEAIASVPAIHCLNICYIFGVDQLKAPPTSGRQHLKLTIEVLELLEANVPFIVARWWENYRDTVPALLRQGVFMRTCAKFRFLCQNTACQHEEREERKRKLGYRHFPDHTKSILLDFFVTYAIVSPYDTPDEKASVSACLMDSLEMGTESLGENSFPTLKGLLNDCPSAARDRVEAMLTSGVGLHRAVRPAAGFLWLMHIANMHQWLTQGEDLAPLLMRAYWQAHLNSVVGTPEQLTEHDTKKVIVTVIRLLAAGDSTNAQRMNYLLQNCDFLSLVERVMLEATAYSTMDDYYPLDILGNIETLVSESRDALDTPLRRDFLYVLDHLQASAVDPETKQLVPLIKFWRDLGQIVGIKERELRAERRRGMHQNLDGAVGCAWIKCVAFDRELDAGRMFWCARCHKAVYCGPLCQKRDWEEGNHKLRCKP